MDTFETFLARLKAAPQTAEVQNAIKLVARCIEYGPARSLDMRIAANSPTFKQIIERALAGAHAAEPRREAFYTHQIDAHLANAGGPMFIGEEIVAALAAETVPPIPDGMMLQIDFTVVPQAD